jgi:Domain of unknown function (DUF4118)
MNGPKTIGEEDAAAGHRLGSFIRGAGEKFITSQILGIRRIPVSFCANLDMFLVWRRFVLVAYVIPMAAVGGAVVATYLLGSTIKYTPNLFFCAVVLSSWLGGVGAGIFSILLSVVALDYFFLSPIYALGLSLEEMPDMILFVTAGLFVNWVNRDGNQAKKPIREARDERNSVFPGKNHGRGKTCDLLRVDRTSSELANEKLDHEASDAKDIKRLNGVPNVTANQVEPDKGLRGELCIQERGAGQTRFVALNGSRKAMQNPPTHHFGRDCVFCKHGDYWTIQYEGEVAWLKATRGLECVACLLGQPGREFHVTELIGQAEPVNDLRDQRPEKVGNHMRIGSLESGDPILDTHAKTEYKLRLTELREELKEADCFNDLDRAEKIQREVNALTEQLTAAVGLGGRNRRAASQAERARSAVTKRIRGSIQRIAKATPSLGRHLAASIKTGYFCSYNPELGSSVRWKL